MSNRAMKFAALSAVAAVALTGCGSNSKSGAAAPTTSGSAAAPATSAAAPATSAAAPATSAAAPATSGAGGGGFAVGVILPDTQSSTRWENQDKPNLTAAFTKAGLKADIQNAQGDVAKFGAINDAMIAEKVKVIILVGLDSTSAAAAEKKAADAGIKTIDYDRLTLNGSADYYVSFDNVKVGTLQGNGLVGCLAGKTNPSIIEINGSPTDNNATLFAQGYNSILDPKYKAGWKKVGDQSVPKWDNTQAGVIFQQLLTKAGGKVDGVLVANDGMAQSVITKLKTAGLTGTPVTGQDATVPGLQSILAGDQCMTVFKNTALEAAGASSLAIALIKGTTPTQSLVGVDNGTKKVPSILLTPELITKSNIEDVIKGDGATFAAICTKDFVTKCKAANLS